jgi:hypothetical protein
MKDKLLYWFFKIAGWGLVCALVYVVIAGWISVVQNNEAYKSILADFLRPIVNLF